MAGPFELVLSGGTLVDGTGTPGRTADIGVVAGNIEGIGDLRAATAVERVDINGLVVAPGFVDVHSHVDLALLNEHCVVGKVSQGVTTEILGADGLSYAPLSPMRLSEQVQYLGPLNGEPAREPAWRSWETFVGAYAGSTAQNVAFLVPWGAVRLEIAGWSARPLRSSEIAQAVDLIASCLRAGAVGVSLGLDYRALAVVDAALAAGVDITFDVYPNELGSSMLSMYQPSWVMDGGPREAICRLRQKVDRPRLASYLRERMGDLDSYVISYVKDRHYEGLVGRTVGNLVSDAGGDLGEAVADLLLANDLAVGYVGVAVAAESVANCFRHRIAMACSDGIFVGQRPHPRGWGAFARLVRRFGLDTGGIGLAECVRKLTSAPAERFGLASRGAIREGQAADLVIFDPRDLTDTATYETPCRPAAGVHSVIVNGQRVWREGAHSGVLPGQVLTARSAPVAA